LADADVTAVNIAACHVGFHGQIYPCAKFDSLVLLICLQNSQT